MITSTIEPKYRKGQSVKIKRGGDGVIVDIFAPPSYLDEPKYAVGFRDGMVFTYQESELAPLPNRTKNGIKHNNQPMLKVEQLKDLWEKDGLKLCSEKHRQIMAYIADYLCEYDVLTTKERDTLYGYLGMEV